MIPGPSFLKSCSNPSCEAFFVQYSARSQNTFGATFWSDGHIDAPMFSHYSDIVKCNSCNSIFRLSNQAPADVMHYNHMSGGIKMEKNLSEWKEAIDLLCYAPGFDTYMEAIGKDVVPDRAVEKETRILAWRSYNDKFRKNIIKGYRKWDSKAVKNAETLIEMLDENDPGEGLQRAELFRELGYFDEALIQLDSLNLSNEDNYANMATQIYALAEQKNPNVTKLEV